MGSKTWGNTMNNIVLPKVIEQPSDIFAQATKINPTDQGYSEQPLIQCFGRPEQPIYIDLGQIDINGLQYESPMILPIYDAQLQLIQCGVMEKDKPVKVFPNGGLAKGFSYYGNLKKDKPVIITYSLEAYFKIAQTDHAVVLVLLPKLCDMQRSSLTDSNFKQIQFVINQLSQAGYQQLYMPVSPEHINLEPFQKLEQNTAVRLLNQYQKIGESEFLIELCKEDEAQEVNAFINEAIVMLPEKIPEFIPLSASVNPFGFPHLSERGKPLNTWENLDYLLNEYGINVRYNVISKKTEVLIPGHKSSIDNKQKATLAEITSLCARNGMPKTEIAQYLVVIGDHTPYNPVLAWIKSHQWDGVSRFADLAATITPDDNYPLEMRDILLKRWLISAVAAAFNTGGFEAHGALVLVGAQGTGKTTWFNRLVCPELRRELVLTGALLDTENKDTIITAVSHWIVELGELDATFRKADIAKLKAFITQGVDKFRRPFEREDDERDRRTVFCASVNQSDYLVDDTGNRRWWTIPAKSIDYMHDIDMQQLWAEVHEWFKNGEHWHLTDDEQAQLRSINASHEQIDPIAEKIRKVCTEPDAKLNGQDWMIAGEVLESLGYRTPNKTQRNIAAKALQDLGFECRVRHKVKQYLVPSILKSRFYESDQDRPF